MTTCKIQCHLKYKIVQATEFVFLIHVADHPNQKIIAEQLSFYPLVTWREFHDPSQQNRYVRLHVEACDAFEVNYSATVERHPRGLRQKFYILNYVDLYNIRQL